jgi:predicted nucleic acid-binding protein
MTAVYYLDTSALVKQYVDESGSDWIRRLLARDNGIFITSHLLLVEMISAFRRRLREGSVTQHDYIKIKSALDNDIRTRFQVVRFDEPVVDETRNLLERYPLRSYDAIHLASSFLMHQVLIKAGQPGITFLCADNRLLSAAKAEGMMVDNPNQHESG